MTATLREWIPDRSPVVVDQPTLRNPFGMDEDCPNCPALVECRDRVVHGYGDVTADFVLIGEAPTVAAEAAGIPLLDDGDGIIRSLLEWAGLLRSDVDPPHLENVYLTGLTRCRHPDRPPTDTEVGRCEPFLNAEIRSINPEILLPIGERAFEAILAEYTTRSMADVGDLETVHATEIRGRGFEIIPSLAPRRLTESDVEALRTAFDRLQGRDYRQTKGGRR